LARADTLSGLQRLKILRHVLGLYVG